MEYGARLPFTTVPTTTETEITALPYVISSPGEYILQSDLSSESSGILVEANDVTINLNGFTLTFGTVAQNYQVDSLGNSLGIATKDGRRKGNVAQAGIVCCDPNYTGAFSGQVTYGAKTGLVVRNGTITEAVSAGYEHSYCINGWNQLRDAEIYDVIMNISADSSTAAPIEDDNHVHHCTFNSTSQDVSNRSSLFAVLQVQDRSVVEHNQVTGGPQGGIRAYGEDVTIRFNQIQQDARVTNGYGVECYLVERTICHDNIITPPNGRGIHVDGSNGQFYNNTVVVKEDPALNPEYDELPTHGIKLENGTGNSITNNHVTAISTPNGYPTALNISLETGQAATITGNIFEAQRVGGHTLPSPAAALVFAGGAGYSNADLTCENNTFISNDTLVYISTGGPTALTVTDCRFEGTDDPVFYDADYITVVSDALFDDCTYPGVNNRSYVFPIGGLGWSPPGGMQYICSGSPTGNVQVDWDPVTGDVTETSLPDESPGGGLVIYYPSLRRISCAGGLRPSRFGLDRNHPLYKGLNFASLGWDTQGLHNHDSGPYTHDGRLIVNSGFPKWVHRDGRNGIAFNDISNSAAAAPPLEGTGLEVTIAFWMYRETAASTGWDQLVAQDWYNGSVGYWFYQNSTQVRMAVITAGSTLTTMAVTNQGVITAGMQHVCFTHDGTTSRIYINGIESIDNVPGVPFTHAPYDFTYGARNNNSGDGNKTDPAKCELFDVLSYNRALTVAEVGILSDRGNIMYSGLIVPQSVSPYPLLTSAGPSITHDIFESSIIG